MRTNDNVVLLVARGDKGENCLNDLIPLKPIRASFAATLKS